MAGGYSNEFGGTSVTSSFFPWIGMFKMSRTLPNPVMEWGTKITGLPNY